MLWRPWRLASKISSEWMIFCVACSVFTRNMSYTACTCMLACKFLAKRGQPARERVPAQKLNLIHYGRVSHASRLHFFCKWPGNKLSQLLCAWCVLVAQATGKPKKQRINDLLRCLFILLQTATLHRHGKWASASANACMLVPWWFLAKRAQQPLERVDVGLKI